MGECAIVKALKTWQVYDLKLHIGVEYYIYILLFYEINSARTDIINILCPRFVMRDIRFWLTSFTIKFH